MTLFDRSGLPELHLNVDNAITTAFALSNYNALKGRTNLVTVCSYYNINKPIKSLICFFHYCSYLSGHVV